MRHPIEPTTFDAANLVASVAVGINRLMVSTWPHIAAAREGTIEFLLSRWETYSGPQAQRPLYHILCLNNELVALAHTFGRTIAADKQQFEVMGLANVCVAQAQRGQGFGRADCQSAFDRIHRGDFRVALFQTTPTVEPLYQRLGAVAVQNRFFNSLAPDPTANPFWDPVAMRYPSDALWPTSDIDLCGPGY